MMKNKWIGVTLFILGLIVPLFFVFRSFFSNSTLSLGDAPHFYLEEALEFLDFPSSWTERGQNFGGANSSIWLSPILLLWGQLAKINLPHNLIIRFLFYFPSLVFSILGIILVGKEWKMNSKAIFFATLFYVFNSYYLLLVDGGQIGVSLAYGLFPLAFFSLLKTIKSSNKFLFVLSLIVNSLLCSVDPRIFMILYLLFSLYLIFSFILKEKFVNRKSILTFVLIGSAVFGIQLYWIYPTFKNNISGLGLEVSQLKFFSLLNSLYVFQPHWYQNVFGKISPPPFYFLLIPLLITLNLFLNKKIISFKLFILFLIFSFLAKGEAEPLGFLYKIGLNLPFGFAFRDSSKFFTALIFCASFMIGLSIENIYNFSKRLIVLPLFYFYLLFLISPALFGQLNFVLSGNLQINNIESINNFIKEGSAFSRSVWFSERSPYTFETKEKPSIDAKNLVDQRIFSTHNTGSSDRFNFMRTNYYQDWFRLLGIKNLIIYGDPREIAGFKNETEILEWQDFKSFIATQSGLKESIVDSNYSVYELDEVRKPILASDYLIGVVGSDYVTSPNAPYVYFEDGKFDAKSLEGIASESAYLYFNDKAEKDLTFSFLSKNFVSGNDAFRKEWSTFDTSDYLKWKYELLIRGIETHEFDYSHGIAMSTKKDEKLNFKIDIEKKGDYILGVRYLTGSENNNIKISFDNNTWESEPSNSKFIWFYKEVTLDSKAYDLNIINNDGVGVFNVAAIIPLEEWQVAARTTNNFVNHFKVLTELEFNQIAKKKSYYDIDYQSLGNGFKLNLLNQKPMWIFQSSTYHPLWSMKKGIEYFKPIPFYSGFNGYYIPAKAGEINLLFTGQENIRWGIYFSIIALLIIFISLFYFRDKKIN